MNIQMLDNIFKWQDGGGVSAFDKIDVSQLERALETESEEFWQEAGVARALRLFHDAAQRVPAYRDFLQKQGVDHPVIKTQADFASVPPTTKENYIHAYPLKERLWDGTFSTAMLTAVSSGTTGEPNFWPRGASQEHEAAVVHELLYREYFHIHERPTLLLIGFPMGVYVSGVATLLPSMAVARKGYPLNIVSVGYNKAEMLRTVKNFASEFAQTVLIGHPFFIKDVFEAGARQGIRWKELRLGMMFCSEGVSDEWREYVACLTEGKAYAESIFSTYGSSELLLMGYETTFIHGLRRSLNTFSGVAERVLGTGGNALPQLFQYIPFLRYMESVDGELLFSAASGMPLIRFNLHDAGQIFSWKDFSEHLPGLPSPKWKLPLVSLAGRSDHTLVFYAANIYPEHLKPVLYLPQFLPLCTGNFSIRKISDSVQDEYLEVHVELNEGVEVSESLRLGLSVALATQLKRVNKEYLFLCQNLDKDLSPRVTLWAYRSEPYFKPGVKPKFIVKV